LLVESLVGATAAMIAVSTVVSHAKAAVRLIVRSSDLIVGE
jgi:hypothetical protein